MKRKLILGLQTAAILAAGTWVFWPALEGGWVWDDAAEVAQNLVLRDPAGVGKIWTASTGPDYFPLKTMAQWAEWRLWGAEPLGYHVTSLALHLASALLFWRLLVMLRTVASTTSECASRRLVEDHERRPPAGVEWLGGLLFAIHPLAVESVAWIAEMKNTLSLPFLLLAMMAYVQYDQTRSQARGGAAEIVRFWRAGQNLTISATGCYFLSLLCFLLAMLAKSSVVMFPFVILLYAWWRRPKIVRRDILGAIPFFAIALALGLVTVWFQQHRAIEGGDLAIGGLGSRLAGAGLAVVFYLEKFFVPVGLMPIYPRWAVVPPSAAQFWPWLALGALVAWLWTKRAGWGRGALFGLGCFGVNLLPVLGLVPMAYLRISWVADHFVYLPMLGLIGVTVGGAAAWADRLERTRRGWIVPLGAAAAVLLGALAWASRCYAVIYRNDEAFWTYALERNPQAWLAQNDLGEILTDAGRLPEAIGHLEAAVRLRPDYPEAHNNLGNALARSGRLPEAIGQFVAALQLEPNYVVARDNLGSALIQSGRFPEAIGQYRQILRLRSDLAEPHASLGYALAATGSLPEAIEQYRQSLRLDPGDARAHNSLGIALARSGRLPEAIGEFQESLRLKPNSAETHYDLGQALRLSQREAAAEAEFAEAARLQAIH